LSKFCFTAWNKPSLTDQRFGIPRGNSSAHLKSGCIASSVTLIVENGETVLGTWQTVYFCGFDGPRNRTYQVKVSGK
jgi:secondary thiamine-phosphate synthase enzyme